MLLSSRFAAARQLLASGSASAGSVRYILEVRYYYCVVVLLRRFKESYTHSHRVLHHDTYDYNYDKLACPRNTRAWRVGSPVRRTTCYTVKMVLASLDVCRRLIYSLLYDRKYVHATPLLQSPRHSTFIEHITSSPSTSTQYIKPIR